MRLIECPLSMTVEEQRSCLENWSVLGDPSDLFFLDIETTGFSRTFDSIYLIGVMTYSGEGFHVHQYLAESYPEEADILVRFFQEVKEFRTCVTYNGDMFDLPFLRERFRRLHLGAAAFQDWEKELTAVDLIKQLRAYQHFFGWPNMKLRTLEQDLGTARSDPFDGGELVDVFLEYSQTKDERLARTLLLHNLEDVTCLSSLMKAEGLIHFLRCGKVRKVSMAGPVLTILSDRPAPLSRQAGVRLYKPGEGEERVLKAVYRFTKGREEFTLTLPETGRRLYYYLPDPGDYYFLPDKEEIVHKSLAYDIPASMRRRARAEQCYITAPEGRYVQALRLPDARVKVYRPSLKSRDCYYREEELADYLSKADPEWLNRYLHTYIDQIV